MHKSIGAVTSARGFSRLFLSLIAACGLVAMTGCGGPGGPTLYSVTGSVTFDGAPVEEGTVSFEDAAAGFAGSGELGPGGTYTAELQEGSYQVAIEPPMEVVSGGADTEEETDYKKVDNIPEKYHIVESSGLSAEVSKSATQHDFAMTSGAE